MFNSIKNKCLDAQLLFTITVRNRGGENRKFSFLTGWAGILLHWCHAGVSCSRFVWGGRGCCTCWLGMVGNIRHEKKKCRNNVCKIVFGWLPRRLVSKKYALRKPCIVWRILSSPDPDWTYFLGTIYTRCILANMDCNGIKQNAEVLWNVSKSCYMLYI